MPDYTLSAKATFDGSNFNSGVNKSASTLDKFKSKCDKVSSKTSGSFGKIVKAASLVGGAISGITTGLIAKGGIDRALNIEQAQYKLKQMGFDVQKVMESVNAAAKGTRYGLDAVATVASTLGASGVQAGDQMTGSLKAVTGMATLTGRSVENIGLIYGKVAAQGRVQGDELMQFSEAGINVTDALAKHFGTTQAAVREMVTAGKVDFANFDAAMQEAYGNAAYGANETFMGALANVNAALSRMGEKFAKPALDSLRGVFADSIPAIDALTASLDPAANKFGEFVQSLGERASGGLQKFVDVLNQTQSPLQAFKAAISETFGAEWGGAINAFVDAFSSVGSVVKDAIQWFVSLDSGTQVAIAQFVAFAAAARPIVSILANVGSKLATFAQGAQKVGTFFGRVGSQGITAATGINKVGTAARSAKQHISVMATEGTKFKTLAAYANSSAVSFRNTGVAAQSGSKSISAFARSAASSIKSLSAVSTGLNVLKGALMSIGTGLLVGAAFAGIGAAIGAISDQMEKARVHSENLEKATTGLVTATRNIPAGAAASSAALDKMSTSSQTAAKSTQELLEAQGQIADSMAQRNEATAQEIGALKGYQEALEQFNGQQLNEEGLARFQLAVDGINDALGTSYTIGQNAQGAYVVMAEGAEVAAQSIQNLIEKKMLEAQLDNAKSNYADAKKAEADAAADLAKNTKELNSFQDRRNELLHKTGVLTQEEREELGELNGRYNELTQNISDDNEMLNAATQSAKAWEDQMIMAQEAMDANADGYTKLVGQNQSLMASLAACGQSSTQFRDQLRELGYDTNELANITDEQWAQIAATYDGTKESIVKGLNEIGVQSEEAARKAQEAVQGMSDAFSNLGGGDFSKFAEQFGTDAAHMAQTLNDWGITAEQVSNMTTDTFKTMADKAGISISELASRFQEAGVDLPDAVDTMVESVNKATDSFSNLGENADFSKFAQSLGMGMDEAASIFTDKCGQLGEISTETVQQMADAFGTSKEAIAAALSAAGLTLPEEVRKWGENAAPAAQDAGQSLGDNVNSGAEQSATDGGESVVQGILDTAQGHEGEFQSIGLSLGNSLSTGFAQADMMSTQTALNNLFMSLSTRTAELTAIGTSWGNALSTGFAMADMMSTQTAITNLMAGLSIRTTELTAIGTSWGNALSTGFAMADMMSTQASITTLMASLSMRTAELTAIGVSWGNALSTGFAQADMMSTAGAVTMFIANLSMRTAELTAIGVSWGNALSTGFATADMMSSGAAMQSFIASLAGYEGQFNAQGVSYGNALSTGFASADMASAAFAISSMVAMISGHQGEFMAAGNSAGMAYASGFASSNVAGAATAVSGLLGAVNAMAGAFSAAGSAAGNAYVSGFSSANASGAVAVVQNVLSQIQAMSFQFMAAGMEAGNGYASGISSASGAVSAAAASYSAAVTSALASASAGAYSSGTHVGSQFAAGISSQAGAVAAAAASLAAAAKANIGHSKPKEGPLRMGEEIFGKHLAQNFAIGIEKNAYYVARASETVAQTVFDYIGHSVPSKGPLSKGETYFGNELSRNFADGITKGNSFVAKASEGIAKTVFDYIGHSTPAKGPLSVGEWVFGVHTATNYADGLGSAEAKDAVSDAAESLADAAAEAWINRLLSAYEARSGEFKAVIDSFSGFITDAASSFFAADTWANTRGNGKNVFGIHDAVYDSLLAIKNAGYDLDSFREKETEYQKELAEKSKEYERKLRDHNERIAEINEQGGDNMAKSLRSEEESWADYIDELKDWRSEYQKFMDVKNGLATQDYLWMAENEPLFDFQYEINVNTSSARQAMNSLAELSKKTGVVFSKEFVERIADGSEESIALLDNLANASTEDVKQMTLAFEDMKTTQRMQEQATRELWVNSLQYQKDSTRQMRDLFLNYKDTVLDVNEALYSNTGLSNAFKMAGVSAEGFALDLESAHLSMEDFTKDFENFSSKVSNGFQLMDSYKQTSLNDWMTNLRKNMAESQAYAKNLQTVMAAIPDTVDSDAFRKAVMSGGFDQWGHVMADLATKSAGDIKDAIELYNQSIIEGQQSAIEQFRALAPGEEYANAFMESITSAAEAAGGDFQAALGSLTENIGPMLAAGLEGAGGQIETTLTGVMHNAANSLTSATGEWQAAGSTLAQSTAAGITAQTGSLVSAATAAVQAAVSAAQAAANAGMASIRAQLASMEREASSAINRAQKAINSASNTRSISAEPMAINALPDLPNYTMPIRSTAGVRGVSGGTTNTYGDVKITANVRSDSDIRRLAKELRNLWNADAKARGLQ